MDKFTREEQDVPEERLAVRLMRNIHRYIFCNLICFVIGLPILAWIYFLINSYVPGHTLPGVSIFALPLLQLPPPIFYGLLALSAMCIAPAYLGFHYIAGAGIMNKDVNMSEFFKKTVQNIKQSVIIGVFGLIFIQLFLWNIFGGLSSDLMWRNIALIAAQWASILFGLFFGMALPYMLQLMPLIAQPIWTIGKNAMILARVYWWRNLLLLVGTLAYWWLVTTTLPNAGLIVLPLFGTVPPVVAGAVICRPLVEKHILDPARRSSDG